MKPAKAGFFVLGLCEIHQMHLHVDLVFLINERKTTLRFYLYFSGSCSLEYFKYKEKLSQSDVEKHVGSGMSKLL